MAERKTKTKRREKKNIPVGKAFITSTFNNTVITLTDPTRAVLSWASAGTPGFRGPRKSTPDAAGLPAETAARRAMYHRLPRGEVLLTDPGTAHHAPPPSPRSPH